MAAVNCRQRRHRCSIRASVGVGCNGTKQTGPWPIRSGLASSPTPPPCLLTARRAPTSGSSAWPVGPLGASGRSTGRSTTSAPLVSASRAGRLPPSSKRTRNSSPPTSSWYSPGGRGQPLVATPLADRYRLPTINWAGPKRARSEWMFHLQVGSHQNESVLLARERPPSGRLVRALSTTAPDRSPLLQLPSVGV